MTGLHAADIELLDTLLTVVEQRRHMASQGAETRKRQAQNLNETGRKKLGREKEEERRILEFVQRELVGLKQELESVIEDEYGADWRKDPIGT